MLTQEQIAGYKKDLEARRSHLMKEIENISEPHNEKTDIVEVGEEEADEAEDFGNQLAAAQALRDEAKEIEFALARIESGDYGKCSQCGADISEEILAVAPESALCAECKAKQ